MRFASDDQVLSTLDEGDTMGARNTAESVANHPALRNAARVGYAVDGMLHLLIAVVALAVARGTGGGKNADQAGALATVAEQPAGAALLWVMCAGLAGLALWQLAETVFPSGEDDGVGHRLKSGAKAVIYGFLSVTAAKFAMGNASGSDSRRSSRGFTATLMDAPAGRFLVGAIGLAVICVGCYYLYKGISRKFTDDLTGNTGTAVRVIGVVGHVAKGIAFGVVGALFIAAAIHHKPEEAAGMDAALRTLKDQPFGPVLLGIVAVGLAAFGIYSFVRARYQRM